MATTEKITFEGSDGQMLAGRLEMPSGKPRAFALWAHCFSCSKDVVAASRVARALTNHGIAVLRFDFTGLGSSEGDFANTNFSSNVSDLLGAVSFLREKYAAPQLLIGHSFGGSAVLAAAPHVREAKAVCTIAAPVDPGHVVHQFSSAIDDIEAAGEAEVQLAGRPFRVKKQFLEDVAEQKLDTAIQNMDKALLVMHAPDDRTVGIENATHIFTAAKHPKSFITLDGADHLLTGKEDAEYVAQVIAAWAERYVSTSSGSDADATPADAVSVEETGTGRFTNMVSIGGRHTFLADEPKSVGGNDQGPTPYDLLLASLGACKSMTMRMYAEHKGFALDKARVTLRHEKIHATDCAKCETETGKIDKIEVAIDVEGDFDAETRQKIIDIADKCPVHRTIQSEVIFDKKTSL
ncbi:MAG: alpha/beta fold hydrolase [Kordiimonadaceae bacterium]|nr:alpha/beta fold hydrolase [Kordiimonadaceae bacterium]MBO6568883.1 alpha/beta fold hydrolase [Kordiimonadaceae bacterium]MBO6965142.1 alpha/beta fold hydrolase [Kordiimonadaceae bacterium]